MTSKPRFNTTNLEELSEVDYNILSYAVWNNEEFEMYPFGRYFGISIDDILYPSKENLQKIAEKMDSDVVVEKIKNEDSMKCLLIFFENQKIDVDVAIDCGFGVIEIAKGEYKGQHFMFEYYKASMKGIFFLS